MNLSIGRAIGLAAYLVLPVVATLSCAVVMAANSLDDLMRDVRNEASLAGSNDLEATFVATPSAQQQLLTDARSALASEQQRVAALKAQFDASETELGALTDALQTRIGDLGELFGVARQVASDATGVMQNSLVSAQLGSRDAVLRQIMDTRQSPSLEALHGLRVLLQQEMTESGKVVRFPATIVNARGGEEPAEVVRVGVFNLVSGDRYLHYDAATGSIQELARQPRARYRQLASGLTSATEGVVPMAVDPTYGSLLGLLVREPALSERIEQGGVIGYVILALGGFGLAIALSRLIFLTLTGVSIQRQLNREVASVSNPLGRILAVYHGNTNADTDTLELKLDEAILREIPRLEKWHGAIKVIAAVAPLLGLLGTVTGMIETFQSITLFGTSDPKLMAGGISQALMTTVLGLVVAIPLVLLHSAITGRSRALIEILEEQSAGIVAAQAEKSA